MREALQRETVDILFITDDKFLMPTCVAIQSLYVNRNPEQKYCIHIVCNQVEEANQKNLLRFAEGNFEIDLLNVVSTELHERFTKKGFPVSISATFKFSLPELFPDLKKALYIDGDVVIQSDLLEFYASDISDVYAGVIKDYHALTFKGNVWERLGICLDAYFNSGVMLLNLERMRNDGITEKLIDYRLNGINYYMDQDTLNVVFGKSVKYLSFNYNMTLTNWRNKTAEDLADYYELPVEEDKYDYLRKADIVHYASSDKPWVYYDTHYADVWYHYYNQSPFGCVNLKRESLHTIINSEKIAAVRIQKGVVVAENFRQGKYKGKTGETPLVSVIAPVYNAKDYVTEALESVCTQSLANFEMICVDDGSTDGSSEILNAWAEKDSRVTVIHQKNQFAGAARNRAMEVAKGDYIVFLDSDDVLVGNALEEYYGAAISTNADVVVAKAAIFGDTIEHATVANKWLNEEYIPNTDVFSAADIYPFIFNFTTGGPGAKCYKRSFVIQNGLEFLTIRKSEDFYFIHMGLAKAERIAAVRKPLYYIRMVPTSVEHQKDKSPLVFWEAILLMKKQLIKEGLYDLIKQSFINENVNRFAYNLRSMVTTEAAEEVRAKLREVHREELGLGVYPKKYYYRQDNYTYLCSQLGLIATTEAPAAKKETPVKAKNTAAVQPKKQEVQQVVIRYTDEAELIRASWSYRIGRFITFIPRKVRGGVRCFSEHGWHYTWQRVLVHLGLKEDPYK